MRTIPPTITKSQPHLHEKGFTLIELLITLLVTSLLLLMIIPAYDRFQSAIEEELIILQLSEDFLLAKNLANIENTAVTICGSIDGKQCIESQSYNWPGWLVFYDPDNTFIPHDDYLIHYFSLQKQIKTDIKIISNRNIGGGLNIKPRRQYAYGMARSIPNGRVNICQKNSPNQYTSIVINVYGYIRLEKKSGAC